jgi:hypothetical protein
VPPPPQPLELQQLVLLQQPQQPDRPLVLQPPPVPPVRIADCFAENMGILLDRKRFSSLQPVRMESSREFVRQNSAKNGRPFMMFIRSADPDIAFRTEFWSNILQILKF